MIWLLFFRLSGKAGRKAAKKRRSLKEGSRYEDLALVEAIINIIKQVEHCTGI